MDFAQLKNQQRILREQSPTNLNLRVHRALSWLQRAEMADDEDGRFIFLWIAFNAAYATEIDERFKLSEEAVHNSVSGLGRPEAAQFFRLGLFLKLNACLLVIKRLLKRCLI